MRRMLARFKRREDGGAMVELVIVMPVMMLVFMAAFESGMYMTRQIMLERGVDLTIRDLRLGALDVSAANGHDVLKTAICDRTPFLRDCDSTIRIELRPVSTTTWNLPTDSTTCFDRDEELNPSLRPNPGVENQLMLVRVCVIQDAIFPGANIGSGIVRDTQGGYALVTVASFVNEP
ncbi:MAG: pilus assembly protein [Paracoccaceae bacterium]|nr:MAG: pilus assembly protein [Paracoccaceae bacterium]